MGVLLDNPVRRMLLPLNLVDYGTYLSSPSSDGWMDGCERQRFPRAGTTFPPTPSSSSRSRISTPPSALSPNGCFVPRQSPSRNPPASPLRSSSLGDPPRVLRKAAGGNG
ncbi:hypothetical protein PMIN04_004018 [Paraphaeosphaeria minitans]